MGKKAIFIALFTCALITLAFIFLGSDTCLDDGVYFQLPSSANAVEKHSQGLTRSCTVWLRFDMNPTELDDFLSSTFINPPLSSTTLPSRDTAYFEQVAGWELDNAKTYLTGEAEGTGERYLDNQFIVIDITRLYPYQAA